MKFGLLLVAAFVAICTLPDCDAFQTISSTNYCKSRISHEPTLLRAEEEQQWTGEVVADEDGRIR